MICAVYCALYITSLAEVCLGGIVRAANGGSGTCAPQARGPGTRGRGTCGFLVATALVLSALPLPLDASPSDCPCPLFLAKLLISHHHNHHGLLLLPFLLHLPCRPRPLTLPTPTTTTGHAHCLDGSYSQSGSGRGGVAVGGGVWAGVGVAQEAFLVIFVVGELRCCGGGGDGRGVLVGVVRAVFLVLLALSRALVSPEGLDTAINGREQLLDVFSCTLECAKHVSNSVYNSETSDKGHSERGQTSEQRTNQKYSSILYTLHKITSERGQPLYKGENAGSQVCPLFGGSTVHTSTGFTVPPIRDLVIM